MLFAVQFFVMKITVCFVSYCTYRSKDLQISAHSKSDTDEVAL